MTNTTASRHALILCVLLIAPFLSSCDNIIDDNPAFAEDDVTAIVSAEAIRAGKHSAPARNLYFEVDDHKKGDFVFHPIALYEGGFFKASLVGTLDGRPTTLASITQRNDQGTYRLSSDVGGLGADSLTLEFYNQNQLLHATGPISSEEGSQALNSVEGEPTSFHYEEDGEDIIIVVDYEDEGGNGGGNGHTTAHLNNGDRTIDQTTHIKVIPLGDDTKGARIQGVRLSSQNAGPIQMVRTTLY